MSTLTNGKIRKIARTHNKANDSYSEVIQFPDSQSATKRIELLPSVVHDLSALEKNLRDAGAALPKDDHELRELLQSVANSDAPTEWVYEAQTGWTRDRQAFVTLDGVIGSGGSANVKGVKRAQAVGDLSGRLSTNGTVDQWRDTVGKACLNSTILMTAISASLAAPLLTIVNRLSFTINLFGKPRSGKTIATLAAGSVIGA